MAVASELSVSSGEIMASKGPEEILENTCIVCYKGVEIYSIGRCDHPVCYECSTRMRVLCQQNECPICRQDMPTVIFTENVRPYSEPKNINVLTDKKFKIVFDSEKVQKAYNVLLAHVCPKCNGKSFQSFNHLREHVRRVHQLNYCDLCVENLKILTRERRCYTRQELGVHRRQGDPDDRSHRGHPLCQFCDTRFVDTDELYRHLRRNHLYCHFCDADGYDHYYSTYEFLCDHFRAEHYLCEEGECYDEKFTAVFRTEIDLKAHRASVHGRAIGKAGVKQARTLELEFTLAPRPRVSRYARPYRDEEMDVLGAVGGIEDPVFTQLNTGCLEEFPSLSGKGGCSQPSSTTSHQSKVTATIRSSTRGFTINDENFPALGPEATVSLHVNSERPKNSVVNTKPPNLSIHVNHRQSGFTTRVSSSTSGHDHFEDNFPALSSSSKISAPMMNVASTQWSSGKKAEPKVIVVKQKSDNVPKQITQPNKFVMENDFPSLSPHFTASCSLSQEVKPSKTVPASYPVNAQSSDSDAVPITTTTRSKKKKKSKNNGATISNTNSTESKKTVSNKSNKTEEGEKSKKKTKDSKENNANNKICVKTESITNGAGQTDKSIADDNKRSKQSNPRGEPSPGMSSEKKKSPQTKPPVNRLEISNNEEFPTLNRPRPPGFSDVAPARVSPPWFEVPKWEIVRPPPGLEPPKHPPLGLEISKPPPGFTIPNGNLLTQLVDGYRYVVPSDFAKRNKLLISKVLNAIGSDKSNNFKDMSVAFRSGIVTAEEYFTSCQETMEPAAFRDIFPELLALLPDIKKQQELWPLYKSSDLKVTSKKNKLDCCANCGQIVKSFDLKDHRSSHALETHFPVLYGSGLTQLPLSNSWSPN